MTHSVRPLPNCGHKSTTFTWVALAELWMCALCIASIGPLYRKTCTRCGCEASADIELVDVFRVGLLCPTCRREYLANRRISFLKGTSK